MQVALGLGIYPFDVALTAMAPRAGSPHQTSIRLEGVEVDYVNGRRPNKKLKLVIAVSGQEPVKRMIARSGPIAWNGSILCPAFSILTIKVYEQRLLVFRTLSARVETSLESLDAPTVTLQDAEKSVDIKLSFSGIGGSGTTEGERLNEDVEMAKKKVEEKPVILEKLGRVRSLIGIIKPVGEAVSGIHPAIDAAFAGIGYLIEACERQEAAQKAAVALTEEWDEFLSISDRIHILEEREESRKAVESMLKVIADAANYMRNHTMMGALDDLFSQEYQEKIDGFKEKFVRAMGSFRLSLEVEAVIGVHELEQDRWLAILKPALEAHYRSGEEHMCLTGTRSGLLSKASEWLRLQSRVSLNTAADPKVFWLFGMAGSGKSSVANTVAEMVEADGDFYLSCFFCKRDDANLSNPQRFFPTLAFRISKDWPSYRKALANFLSTSASAGIITSDIKKQFKLLFGDLLPATTEPGRPVIIVIDALDECGTQESQGELAECILSLAQAAPWIKVFITSRPVPEIHAIFASSVDSCILSNINEEADTDADIRRFTETNLELVRKKHNKLVLSSDEVDRLVRQAAGLFIWSSTLFKFVRTSRNPPRELRSFLSAETSKEPLEQLYELYEQVLKSAVNAGHKEDVAVLHAILGTVFITAGNRPLSVEALSTFLHADNRFQYEDGASVRNMTQALHAVLYEDASMGGAVRVYHPSFLDFLQMKLESGFQFSLEEIHRLVFRGCMATMAAELKFNICDLQDSSVLNKDVPDLKVRISTFISEALYYSSLFWFAHLSKSGLKHDEEVKSLVSDLLCTRRFLFWLEVLSVLGAVTPGAAILRDCVRFFEGSPDIADVVSDLERFVQSSSEAMQSAPHIYLSALTWVPEETLTQEKIAAQFKNLHWIIRKEASWEGTRWVKTVGGQVKIVAYSPDGRFVAAGMHNTVRILDGGTGEPVGEPLQCDGYSIKSVSFSNDGERITIVSSNTATTRNVKTGATVRDPLKLKLLDDDDEDYIRITAAATSPNGSLIACGSSSRKRIEFFDAQTGVAVGEPLEGHTNVVKSIAFSPDGQLVVSGSDDKTIRIWDVKTRTAVGNPLEGHEDCVWSVCYSPDGRWIISGSWDNTVRIWHAQTGAALFEPLRDHSSGVLSVTFSPDGRWIASGSYDGTIWVWDTNTRRPVGKPLQGHPDHVYSVVFTPDGRHIVSGSSEGTVCMWDVGFSSTAGAASEGHSDEVRSVSFSPDGERIASGSGDGTVRLWHTKTGAAIGRALEGHGDGVNSVCFSPDGLLVASASDDKTVRFWDAFTSAAVGEPLEGHTDSVLSITFSPDGQRVVSGSDDATICIWDVKTRTAVGNPIEGHEREVNSVSYSPDGGWIVSGSSDNTVRIWNAQTGAALFEPLGGHSSGVRSVAFSPSGQWIASASGSDDWTIRIWDAKTGAAIGDPLQCDWVRSVAFSSDSRRIVSGHGHEYGGDGEIRIWDVETRTEIAEPLRSHSTAVLAVAFSPDGQHIASGSDDHTFRIWDAVDLEGGSSTDARWNECCMYMDLEDGWVKDEEKLLLWVPHRYRKNFRIPHLQVCIERGALTIIRPEVDPEMLFTYTGTGWTRFYEE